MDRSARARLVGARDLLSSAIIEQRTVGRAVQQRRAHHPADPVSDLGHLDRGGDGVGDRSVPGRVTDPARLGRVHDQTLVLNRGQELLERPRARPVVERRRADQGLAHRVRRGRHVDRALGGGQQVPDHPLHSLPQGVVVLPRGGADRHRGLLAGTLAQPTVVHPERLFHEHRLRDDEVAGGPQGGGGRAVGEDGGAAVVLPQPQQHRREVGVRGEHDEVVEPGDVAEGVDDVEHHVDVGAVLALRGQGRAVDDAESRRG